MLLKRNSAVKRVLENDLCETRGEEVLHPASLFRASLVSCKLLLHQWPLVGLLHLLLLDGRVLLRKGALLRLRGWHRDLLALLLLLGTWCRARAWNRDWHGDLFAFLFLLGTWCRFRTDNKGGLWHLFAF